MCYNSNIKLGKGGDSDEVVPDIIIYKVRVTISVRAKEVNDVAGI